MNSVFEVHSRNMWNTQEIKTTKWSSPLPLVTQMKDYRRKSWEEMGCTVSLAFPKPFSDCNRGRCWSTICDWTDGKMYHNETWVFTWSSALVWFVSGRPLFQSEFSMLCGCRQKEYQLSFKNATNTFESFKFLGVHNTNELSWSKHTKTVMKRTRQRLFPLRRMKKFGMGPQILDVQQLHQREHADLATARHLTVNGYRG